ncbi:hypothetical protein [Denitromonas iodatirespirans]|nr:hypothetical protein [Denitromonas iodatirespirans]
MSEELLDSMWGVKATISSTPDASARYVLLQCIKHPFELKIN